MGNNRRVVNTAIYYWRRFYAKQAFSTHCHFRVHFTDVHPYLAVPTCYYLASKVEEVAANVSRVLSSFEGVLKLHKIDPIKWTIDDVLSCENLILLKLDYCLLFFDPFRYLRHFLSLCHLEDCLQACTLLVFSYRIIDRNIVNDSFYTLIPITHAPHIVAATAVYMICTMNNIDPVDVFTELKFDVQEIYGICATMCVFYEKGVDLWPKELTDCILTISQQF
ncbi:uncharacterized protein [Blastocystis hominis]|uniref:Cyclin N-terminal domain-containing protein n=1 Tax=Blastocystis hominis TaxID=12968 RepID=D8LZT1_BLAHO|nr:uncharacterized protein [Blastocystis hominis]CBK21320.2 unnamed protein product [Blastocystis hominis]|eukprot:XP_012895368.1 uncharacterized protein [Blastocystis hominis]